MKPLLIILLSYNLVIAGDLPVELQSMGNGIANKQLEFTPSSNHVVIFRTSSDLITWELSNHHMDGDGTSKNVLLSSLKSSLPTKLFCRVESYLKDDSVDQNNDEIPDWWQRKYTGELTNAIKDVDADSIVNKVEFLIGADPKVGYEPVITPTSTYSPK